MLMRWILLVAFVITIQGASTTSLLAWSPIQLLTKSRLHLGSVDLPCLMGNLANRPSSSSCLSKDSGNKIEKLPGNDSPSAIVAFLSENDDTFNMKYFIGSYATSESRTLFDVLDTSKTIVEVADDVLPSSYFNDYSEIIHIDAENVQDFEMPLSPDPVVFKVNLLGLTPEIVRSVIDRVNDQYGDKYVGVFSDSNHHQKRLWAVLQEIETTQAEPQASDFLTWEILVSIIVSLFMISVLGLFFNLLASIETPLRFQRRPFDVSKEY